MHCREIATGFFEKVSFPWKDALRHTVSFLFVNVLQIYLYLTVEILGHQQPPGAVYRGFFVTKFKITEIDHIPGDYLVTLFTFGRFVRWGNPSYRRFLKNENSIIAIFTKSTWYYPILQPNNPLLRYRYLLLLSECQKVRDLVKNCYTAQRKLYPCLSYWFFFIAFWKGKNCSLIKMYRMNQNILEKISNQIPPND